jgi:hypothetical protein
MTVFHVSRPGLQLKNATPSSSARITSSQLRIWSVNSTECDLNLFTCCRLPGRLENMFENAT